MQTRKQIALVILLAVWIPFGAHAALLVNPPMPITHQVTVNLIQVSDDDGNNTATAFGNAANRLAIENAVDTIWAQAGIDVLFLDTIQSYHDTFTLGNSFIGGGTRPESDFDAIIFDAGAPDHPTSTVINFFFLETVPDFAHLNENQVAGYARIDGNGITFFSGDSLFGNPNNLDLIASVAAHEIGHNLGLRHVSIADNLMQSSVAGEQLNAAQISAALGSFLVLPVSVPIPAAGWLLASALVPLFARWRREEERLAA